MANYYVSFDVLDDKGEVIFDDGYTVEASSMSEAEIIVATSQHGIRVTSISPVGECGS